MLGTKSVRIVSAPLSEVISACCAYHRSARKKRAHPRRIERMGKAADGYPLCPRVMGRRSALPSTRFQPHLPGAHVPDAPTSRLIAAIIPPQRVAQLCFIHESNTAGFHRPTEYRVGLFFHGWFLSILLRPSVDNGVSTPRVRYAMHHH